jgi:transmembrane sensor
MEQWLVAVSLNFHHERDITEAAAWLARLHASDRSVSDETAFHAWLASDPAHEATFEYVTNIWEQLGSVPRKKYAPEKVGRRFSRRTILAGGVGVVVCGSVTPFVQGGAEAQVYYTAVGEQKHMHLPDDTKLLLDTNTSISVTKDSKSCLVRLERGRINCRVAPTGRQFAFMAADHLVAGENSIFDLSYLEKYFSVVMIQGHGVINTATGPVKLNQGERATALDSQLLSYDRPPLASLTSWQTGHLMFKDETIGDAVKEMNRYSNMKIEIDNPQIASQKVSGGYLAGDNTSFAEDLAHLYPIGVRRIDGMIHLIGNPAT